MASTLDSTSSEIVSKMIKATYKYYKKDKKRQEEERGKQTTTNEYPSNDWSKLEPFFKLATFIEHGIEDYFDESDNDDDYDGDEEDEENDE